MKSHFHLLYTVTLFGIQYILGQSTDLHKTAICKVDSVMLKCDSESLISLQDIQLLPKSGKDFNKKVCFNDLKTKFLNQSRLNCDGKQSCSIIDNLVVDLAKCLMEKQNSSSENCTKDKNNPDDLCWLDNAIKDVKPSNACRSHSMCYKTGTILDEYCDQKSFTKIHWICLREKQETTSNSSKTIALAVGISAVGIIIAACVFVLLWRRLKVKKKDPEIQMNYDTAINGQEPHYTGITATDSEETVHQHNSLSSKPTSTTHINLDGSNCNLQDFSSKSCLNKDNSTHNYDDIDMEIDISSNKLDNERSDGAYFILEPTEQSDSRGTSVNVADEQYGVLDWNKKSSLHRADAYADENLYGISEDELYNASSHERTITTNDTYDHFNNSS